MLGDVGDVGDDDDDDRSERHSLVRPCVVCMRRRRFVGPNFTDQPSGYPRNGMPGFRCDSVQGRIGSHSERTGGEGDGARHQNHSTRAENIQRGQVVSVKISV